MQAFGNVATDPIRKVSKATQKAYYELRLSENRKNGGEATWYTVRLLAKDANPGLSKGDFCKVTGTLKVDSYLSRDGKPTSTLVIIAFEAVRIKSVQELRDAQARKQAESKKEAVAA